MTAPLILREGHNGVALLTIANPPVNALSHSVRLGLQTELAKAKDDANIKAVVLACAGRSFISGFITNSGSGLTNVNRLKIPHEILE